MVYDVGTAYLQILPSFAGAVEAISAEAAKWGETSGTTFAEAFKTRVDAALKSLPDAKVGLDATEADTKLAEIRAELESLSGEHIGVSISDNDAQARLAALRANLDELGAKHPEIRVSVDAAQAELELAGVAVTADAVGSTFGDLGAGAGGAGTGLESLGADAGAATGEMSALIPAVIALGTALIPIGGLALGALSALPALFAGAASGAAALYLGLSGIPAALQAFSAQKNATVGGVSNASTALANAAAERNAAFSVQSAEDSLTKARLANASAVAAAERAVAAAKSSADQSIAAADKNLATAQQNVSAAQVAAVQAVANANQNLVNAERAVTDAQYNEQQAQQAVINAREQAQRQLEDYTNQLANAGLAQRQAALDVQTSLSALQAAQAPGSGASQLQIEQLQLNYDQAIQRVKDLATQNEQLTQDATAAQAAGIDGNTQVLNAQHQLATAQQATLDALANQQTAQENVTAVTLAGNQKIAAAQQAVTDAQNKLVDVTLSGNQKILVSEQAVATARRNGALSILDAQRNVTQAQLNQADAIARAAIPTGAAATATQNYQRALAGLSPAGRSFVKFITGELYPAFEGFKGKVQAAFLPLLQSALTDLLPFFRDLGPVIIQAANGLGGTISEMAKFMGSKAGLSEVMQIFKDGNYFMNAMGGNFVTLFKAFTKIGSEATPVVHAMAGVFTKMIDSFAHWVDNGGFQKFLVWLEANGPSIITALESVLVTVGKLAVALAPVGLFILTIVTVGADLISWLASAWQRFSMVLIVVGSVGAAFIAIVGGPITALVAAIALIVAGLIIVASHWRDVWASIQKYAKDAWDFIDKYLVHPLVDFFSKTVPKIFDAVVSFFKGLPERLLSLAEGFAKFYLKIFAMPYVWLWDHIGSPIMDFFAGLPDKIASAAVGMWHGISDAFKAAINTVIGWWDDLHFKIPGFSLGPVHFGGFELGMPPIPKFHDGGVVGGTPGVEQLAFLMPGEIVTPKGALLPTSGSHSNVSLELNIHGADLSKVDQIRQVVTDAFGQFVRELTPMRTA